MAKNTKSMDSLVTEIIGGICLITSLAVGFIFAYFVRINIIKNTDEKLFLASTLYSEILGPNFHDLITDVNSIKEESYKKQIERNSKISKEMGLQYLWSVLYTEGKFVFTSATRSNLEDPASPYANFYETHSDPDSFVPALQKLNEPVYSTFHNKWGEGRMVLLPKLDKYNRRYIIGASIQLKDLNHLIYKSVLIAVLFGFSLFLIVWKISKRLSKRITGICSEVTFAANQIRDGNLDILMPKFNITDAVLLTESLDDMRKQLKIRIQDLENNNLILNQIIDEKKVTEERLNKISEIQSILIKISAEYINVPNDKIKHSIESSLKELGKYVGADRAYIFDYDWNKEVCSNKYEWCDFGISPQIDNLQNIPINRQIFGQKNT